mmetsp:Transcript_43057/g.101642  ORF Transcript_43057/g.101642 Transcript_43057/m.101642 type:complete len:224 (-) Transcript_43057:2104-2775(-)
MKLKAATLLVRKLLKRSWLESLSADTTFSRLDCLLRCREPLLNIVLTLHLSQPLHRIFAPVRLRPTFQLVILPAVEPRRSPPLLHCAVHSQLVADHRRLRRLGPPVSAILHQSHCVSRRGAWSRRSGHTPSQRYELDVVVAGPSSRHGLISHHHQSSNAFLIQTVLHGVAFVVKGSPFPSETSVGITQEVHVVDAPELSRQLCVCVLLAGVFQRRTKHRQRML